MCNYAVIAAGGDQSARKSITLCMQIFSFTFCEKILSIFDRRSSAADKTNKSKFTGLQLPDDVGSESLGILGRRCLMVVFMIRNRCRFSPSGFQV